MTEYHKVIMRQADGNDGPPRYVVITIDALMFGERRADDGCGPEIRLGALPLLSGDARH